MSERTQNRTSGAAGAARRSGEAAIPIQLSERRRLLRAFLRQRLGLAGLTVIVIVFLLSVCAPLVAPYGWREQSIANRFQNVSRAHLLGTDELGRDIFTRVLYGGRYSLLIAVTAVVVSFCIGTLLGMLSGFYPRLDGLIMRGVDILLAFPGILLAIAIVSALGPGVRNLIIAIGVNEIPGFARLTRSMVLSLREREFVVAARVIGATDPRIAGRHVLVNLASPLIVFATLRISTTMLIAATLSFLGLGVQPPNPEWGAMVSTAREYVFVAPHAFFYPALVIFFVVIAFNLLGDALRDTLDPTMRR